ncbi:hypothetical protein [Colwellia piezophila]|uniref:hypothetical protein n=1 Tax=Colwellia piezophila TaxID=211668 RepID=UPI00036D4AEE|nr:hypothetical protein [Colwellia piezophila]
MKSISLTQVTAFVVAVTMASFLVNADKALAHSAEGNDANHSEHSTVSAVSENVVLSTESFTFTSLDINKDGKLSQQEVLAGKNTWLVNSFKQIDSNLDELLTEQEIVDFVSKTAAAS